MDGENVKVKDRVELSLDGRQIASVVVGALVLLGVVFVLGLNVGRQLAVKQLESTRGDALAALDQPPPAAPAAKDDALTFHERLTRERSPAEEPASAPAAPPVVAAKPEPAPAAAQLAAAPAPAEPAAAPAKPDPAPAAPKADPPAHAAKAGAFAVQVVATPNKAEAEKLAAKLEAYQPRVETADVPGKGRFYRVRVGSFGSKPEAEKFLKTFVSKTGSKGLVVAGR